MKYILLALVFLTLLPLQVSAATSSGWIFVSNDPNSSYQKYCGPSYNREVVDQKTKNGKTYQKIRCVRKTTPRNQVLGNSSDKRSSNNSYRLINCSEFVPSGFNYQVYKKAKIRDSRMSFPEYKNLSNKYFGMKDVSTNPDGTKVSTNGLLLLNQNQDFKNAGYKCATSCWNNKTVTYSTKRANGITYYFVNLSESSRCR